MNASTDTPVGVGNDHREGGDPGAGPDFVYDVDGATYRHDRPKITGSEIMAAADIPASDGLVQLLTDGTTETIGPEDEVHLVPGVQFKRRPKFKRG